MKDIGSFLPILGIILVTIFLTISVVLILKFSKRVDSPKYIWYPILVNTIGMIVVFALTFVAVILFGLGFAMMFGKSDEFRGFFLLAAATFALIPILMFLVRAILFLLFKLAGFPYALLYSFLSTLISLVVIVTATFIFAGVYTNL